MDKMKNPAVVGDGQYDRNGAALTSFMNTTTIIIKRARLEKGDPDGNRTDSSR
jgi:hypothetical protein